MVQSIQFEFDMHVIEHSSMHCIGFGKFRIYNSFAGEQKRILMRYGLWNQSIKSILMSNWCIQLSMCIIGHRPTYNIDFGVQSVKK